MPWCHLLAEIREGVGDVRIIIDEAAVKIGETEEGLDISDVAGCQPGLDCGHFGWVHLEPLGR